MTPPVEDPPTDIVLGLLPTPPATRHASAVEDKLRDLTIAWCRFDYFGPIYAAESLDALLADAADDGHRYCAVQYPGHLMRRYRDRSRGIDSNFLELAQRWCRDQEMLVAGDLVSTAEGQHLRPSCFIVDLALYHAMGRPAAGEHGAGLTGPLPVLGFSEDLDNARCDFTDPARKSVFTRYLGDGILGLDPAHDASELPERDVALLTAIHGQAKYARQGVFLTNYEGYDDLVPPPEDFVGPVHTFLGPAAGFKANYALEVNGFDDHTRVCYFDYSQIALDFKRSMVEGWDGNHLVDFLRDRLDDLPQAFFQVKSGPGSLDYEVVERNWKAELERWGGSSEFRKNWNRCRALNHRYLLQDLFGDREPLLDCVPAQPNTILWVSNAFHSLNGCWFYTREKRNEIYDRWIDELAQKNPELWLYGKDVNNIDIGRTRVRDHLGRESTAI